MIGTPLLDGEKPLRAVRQHQVTFLPYCVAVVMAVPAAIGWINSAVALTLLAALAMAVDWWYWRLRHRLDFRWHAVEWSVLLALTLLALRVLAGPVVIILVAGAVLTVRWLTWYVHVYTLTNMRVIDEHGLVTRVSESWWISRIQHTTLERNVLGLVVGFGDLVVYSAGRGREVLHDLPHAELFHTDLVRLVGEHGRSRHDGERATVPDYDAVPEACPPLGYGADRETPAMAAHPAITAAQGPTLAMGSG